MKPEIIYSDFLSKKEIKPPAKPLIEGGTGGSQTALPSGLKIIEVKPALNQDLKFENLAQPVEIISKPIAGKSNHTHNLDMSGDDNSLDLSKIFNGMSATPIA